MESLQKPGSRQVKRISYSLANGDQVRPFETDQRLTDVEDECPVTWIENPLLNG